MNTFMERRRRRESMSLRSATDLFSEWADVGRDEGMERGHSASVEVMLKELLEGGIVPFEPWTSVAETDGWCDDSALTPCVHTPAVLTAHPP